MGPVVRRWAGKQDIGSIPFQLSLLISCALWTPSCDFAPHNKRNVKIAAHLNAEVIVVVAV